MRFLRLVASLALLLVAASPAQANMGIPMLALAWPVQWLALVPIIGIEAVVLTRMVGGAFKGFVWPVAKANFLSTLVGVPLAWAAMLALGFAVGAGLVSLLPEKVAQSKELYFALFPFYSAWVGGSSPWEVFAASVVLAVPFGAASIHIEYKVLKRAFRSEPSRLKSAVVMGNVATYGLLVILALLIPLTA